MPSTNDAEATTAPGGFFVIVVWLSGMCLHVAVACARRPAYTRRVLLLMEFPMLRSALAGTLALALVPVANAAVDCSASPVLPAPLPATVVAPVAAELHVRQGQLGMPSGVLSSSEVQSLDLILMRLRVESCNNVAKAVPAGAVANSNDPAAYKPQTAYDNTPWRFDMSQGDKRMTADEFDAWMKARGARVVRPREEAPAAAQPAPATK